MNVCGEAPIIRVLIVDDDKVARKLHTALLKRYKIIETEEVENGREAVDIFLSGKKFDLVLMDLEMPIMDGIQATRELRGMGVSSMIVGVTACEVEEKKREFEEAGLDDCWNKPLNAVAIIAMLNELAKKLL